MKNRYSELQDNTENTTELYQHLINANKEAAKNLLHTKEKCTRNKTANNPRIERDR